MFQYDLCNLVSEAHPTLESSVDYVGGCFVLLESVLREVS